MHIARLVCQWRIVTMKIDANLNVCARKQPKIHVNRLYISLKVISACRRRSTPFLTARWFSINRFYIQHFYLIQHLIHAQKNPPGTSLQMCPMAHITDTSLSNNEHNEFIGRNKRHSKSHNINRFMRFGLSRTFVWQKLITITCFIAVRVFGTFVPGERFPRWNGLQIL